MSPGDAAKSSPPLLVAHRGYALRYPENTLEALRAAFEAGACYVEFDVQLSSDRIPVLMHDPSLLRTAGRKESVFDLSLDRLRRIEVNERQRLGRQFRGVRIPTLSEAVELVLAQPRGDAFVEIKSESVARFGLGETCAAVMGVLEPALDRHIVISFDIDAIRRCRELGASRIGWVLADWGPEIQSRARALAPEFLFCNRHLVPAGAAPWSGPWRWAVYEVTDPDEAMRLGARGFDLVETMAIREMFADVRLGAAACLE